MKKTKLGQELIAGMNEAIAYTRGELTLRSHDVSLPDEPAEWSAQEIARLRTEKLRVSQPILAAYLGVKPSALKAWEQGLKKPAGSARRLLELLAAGPNQVIELMKVGKSSRKRNTK